MNETIYKCPDCDSLKVWGVRIGNDGQVWACLQCGEEFNLTYTLIFS